MCLQPTSYLHFTPSTRHFPSFTLSDPTSAHHLIKPIRLLDPPALHGGHNEEALTEREVIDAERACYGRAAFQPNNFNYFHVDPSVQQAIKTARKACLCTIPHDPNTTCDASLLDTEDLRRFGGIGFALGRVTRLGNIQRTIWHEFNRHSFVMNWRTHLNTNEVAFHAAIYPSRDKKPYLGFIRFQPLVWEHMSHCVGYCDEDNGCLPTELYFQFEDTTLVNILNCWMYAIFKQWRITTVLHKCVSASVYAPLRLLKYRPARELAWLGADAATCRYLGKISNIYGPGW
eukprot:TRINITY_DN66991_c2_g1_i28.p1 TRINITY_DN66991_c2_g1~~TRINITY_DN66991_c2_g1_i28.p1  ORF type:complete len:288 (+),score=12.58 TRINITY_DN66991_c2_g1_i28:295-1158(+)